MVRRILALVLLGALAACTGNITAADDGENRNGTMVTGGG